MTLKVYVSCPSEDLDKAKDLIKQVDSIPGVEVVYDWTESFDHEKWPKNTWAWLADRDVKEAGNCDLVVIFALDGKVSSGVLIELGAALYNDTNVLCECTPGQLHEFFAHHRKILYAINKIAMFDRIKEMAGMEEGGKLDSREVAR